MDIMRTQKQDFASDVLNFASFVSIQLQCVTNARMATLDSIKEQVALMNAH